jgi:hypothetical protein
VNNIADSLFTLIPVRIILDMRVRKKKQKPVAKGKSREI